LESFGGDLFETLKIVIQRVTVVEFGVDSSGNDRTGCFRIKARTDTTEFTDMRIAGLRK